MKILVRSGIVLVALMLHTSAMAQIRINEVGYNGVDFEGATKWVELYNAGDVEVDVSALILCNFPMYPTIGSLTVLGGGSTTIPAGGYLVVAWNDLGDADGEVGLYAAGTLDFADQNAIMDYMQYGSAGHFREPVAVGAGLWTAGAFVPGAEAGKSLQLIIDPMTGEEEWEDRAPTPNAENSTATSIDDIDELPDDFRLFANYPNPFNPETTIAFELERAGQVTLSVYDMLGKKITDLFRGNQPAGEYSVAWDGRDARGQVVASGLYLYRLTLDDRQSQSRVMTLLK